MTRNQRAALRSLVEASQEMRHAIDDLLMSVPGRVSERAKVLREKALAYDDALVSWVGVSVNDDDQDLEL